MSHPTGQDAKRPTRDERLAAKLRENLKRRKAQARLLDGAGEGALPKPQAKS